MPSFKITEDGEASLEFFIAIKSSSKTLTDDAWESSNPDDDVVSFSRDVVESITRAIKPDKGQYWHIRKMRVRVPVPRRN